MLRRVGWGQGVDGCEYAVMDVSEVLRCGGHGMGESSVDVYDNYAESE